MNQEAVSRVIKVNGLSCHYLEWGDPGAPPVLLLHGLRSYAATWQQTAQALAGDHRLIAPDFRGRGDSSWDPQRRYYAEYYVRDMKQLIHQVVRPPLTVVGHSLGGTVGYLLAAQCPELVRALVIEDIGPGSSAGGRGAERIRREMRATPSGFDSLDSVRDYWRKLRPGISEDALASRVDNTVQLVGDGRYAWKLDMEGIAEARLNPDPAVVVDLWPAVDALRCPTLVLRGERSDFLSSDVCRQMAERQPLIRWDEIPAAAHYAHDDNPGAFQARLTQFLAEVRA
ncbi:alpha/beta fold hydrolase [Flexivirga caeni]|uniref:Alpha/beta fold hydrolase n=1 Tax=Flexivirga caeni TaxID=2294115 RepID=A0A3M9ME95_9MICO|nr:alpha/beta fold hydrolase [Flexivirga caeni]RNI22938.1 alpha/beta fold hydrolase [Flexivirga caeni]